VTDGWLEVEGRANLEGMDPMATEVTIEILKSIRDEVKETNARLDQTNTRLESMRDELSRRIVESELRTATAITELAGTIRELKSRVG
jgi:hypothetical protein